MFGLFELYFFSTINLKKLRNLKFSNQEIWILDIQVLKVMIIIFNVYLILKKEIKQKIQ